MKRFATWIWVAVVCAGCTASGAASGPGGGPDDGGAGADGVSDAVSTDGPRADGVGDAPDATSGPWRSELYPADWSPGHTGEDGRFLHDFSYAGYRNSEAKLGRAIPDRRFDVVEDFGGDPSGETPSTEAVRRAVDAAEKSGGVVFFPAGRYRITGRIRIESSKVVLRGEGPEASRLFFPANEEMSYASHLEFRGKLEHRTEWKLSEDAENRSRRVTIEVDGKPLPEVGDDVAVGWVITEAFVRGHQMSEHWREFNGEWQPFFRREVEAVEREGETATVELDVPLRYPAFRRDGASLRRTTGYIREVGVEDLGLADAIGWDAAWKIDQTHVLEFHGVEDGWIRRVESFPSPAAPQSGPGSEDHLRSGGILIEESKRVTVAESSMAEAQNRGGGGNGYLFEIRRSNEILTRDSVGRAGRHNFIQNWGFGTTGCVWLRVQSSGGVTMSSKGGSTASTGLSEFHHSLAMANLVDASTLDDGWAAENRKDYSSGAGHTATQSVFWNVTGTGRVRSYQYGWGYLIGVGSEIDVVVEIRDDLGDIGPLAKWENTEPRDWVEGRGRAGSLRPRSLFESQLERRLGR
ncbi:MAG: glycosyl hydrolase family 28-related protein [Bradymonadaceae bacterium]